MIPILFPSTETQFVSNGIGRLRDCVSCQVTEERNGVYELEFVYPVNGWRFSDIQEGMLIGVIHDDNHDIQPFEIYRAEANLDGTKTFYARHISYKLTNAIVSPFAASDASGAFSGIASNIINGYLFTFTTDKSNAGDFIVNRPASVRTALLGEEGSILDIYGGEYKFDKFSVSLLASRGRDTGVTVRYGKNMVGMEQEQDDGETFNAVAPYVVSGDAIVYLPEYYVQPTKPPTQALKIRAVDFTASFPTAPTEAELRQAAREWIDASRPWIPTSNIKIDFVALWQTEQYKNVAAIQRVGLCDTVSIYYTDLGIVAEKAKIIRTVFDVLTERFAEIEVGTPQTQFVEVTGDTSVTGASVLPEYVVESVSGATQSVAGGANYSGSFDCAKANYKPLAIAGFSANSAACSFARLNLNGTTITFNMRNNTSTAAGAKPEVWVVYQRI